MIQIAKLTHFETVNAGKILSHFKLDKTRRNFPQIFPEIQLIYLHIEKSSRQII